MYVLQVDGNVALDCATSAVKVGAKTSKIIYRRTENEMKTSIDEFNLATKNNVDFEYLALPIKLIGDNEVKKIECIKMELGKEDETGRRYPVEIKGSNYFIDTDIVVWAIGSFIDETKIDNIQINDKSKLIKINENYQTNIDKVFTGGDCATKDRTVANASHMGIEAAKNIIKFLEKQIDMINKIIYNPY